MYNEHFPAEDEKKEHIESQIEDCLEQLEVLREDLHGKISDDLREQWKDVEKATHGKTFGWSREVILVSLRSLIEELEKARQKLGQEK